MKRNENEDQYEKSYEEALEAAASQVLEVDSNQNPDPNREKQLDDAFHAFLDELQEEWKKKNDEKDHS